ncbi:Tenascin-X [Geodia barretti]|uniref:Tenascin-X n=1 Tax=Geodia barretti TaxID=519541 RepID=A0AA35VZQ2_GEOBA|nr:Tenascin-X [Geodia barretti]
MATGEMGLCVKYQDVRTAATFATCVENQCKCRDGYSGNGTSCEAKCENCSQYATCKNGKCMCMEDYVGDGITCDEECQCIINATCVGNECICSTESNDVDCNNCTKQTCKTQNCSTCDEVIVVCKMCVSAESNSKDLRWLAFLTLLILYPLMSVLLSGLMQYIKERNHRQYNVHDQ